MTWLRMCLGVVRRLLPAAERDDACAVLEQLHRHRRDTRGPVAAASWLAGQTVAFPARWYVAHAFRRRGGGTPPIAPGTAWRNAVDDARYALRGFTRAPGFTFVAVATLAVGFGLNSAIFAVVNATVFRDLPFADPPSLVYVWPNGTAPVSGSQFEQLAAAVSDEGELSAFVTRQFAVAGSDRPVEVAGVAVSGNHFSVVGLAPLHGRPLMPSDARPGAPPVAVISYDLWRSQFAGEEAVVGRNVDLFQAAAIPMVPGAFSGESYTIVGVLPPGYDPFGYPARVYTPLVLDSSEPGYSNMVQLGVIARLRAPATPERLRAQLVVAAERIESLQTSLDAIRGEDVRPLRDALVAQLRSTMLVTLGAVGLVLLIACANVANLLLVRGTHRRLELSVRAALGASRIRLAQQLAAESVVLSVIAGGVGLLAAWAALPALVRALPPSYAPSGPVSVDPAVIAFTLVSLVVVGLLSGLAPAIRSTSNADGGPAGSRTVGATKRRHVVSGTVVSIEIALALMLTCGAGLLLKSFERLSAVDTGLDAASVMAVRIAPSESRYRSTEVRRQLFGSVLEQVRRLPGVTSAGAIHFLPIAEGGPGLFFRDPRSTDGTESHSASYRVVTEGYFETLRIPIRRGRGVRATDRSGTPAVGWVNQALADQLWPGVDPVGQNLYRTNGALWFTVAGVVGNVRQSGPQLAPSPEAYIPLQQSEWSSAMTVVVRTDREVERLAETLRETVWSLDPNVPITRVQSMEAVLGDAVLAPRFYSRLFAGFALLALFLGAVGVYGVASFIVGSRANEIGVRLALGASTRRVLVGEFVSASRAVAIGIALGLTGAALTSRLLSDLLYEVAPIDAWVYAGATAFLGAVAAAGTLLPARRAAQLDPAETLRLDR